MCILLDSEWADVLGSELVSVALVSAHGVYRFHVECAPLPDRPADFVQQVVYPLLERGPAAITDQAMTTGLRAFLLDAPDPIVVADFHHDLTVLRHALAGLEMPNDQIDACGPALQPVVACMLKEELMGTLVEDCFAGHPQAAARGHHAMVDAEAMRVAWLTVTSPIPPQAWARLTMQSSPEAS